MAIVQDTLYRGITRPPMMRIVFFELTLASFMISLAGGMLVFAIMQSLWYLAAFPLLFSLCIAVEMKEPRAFFLIGLWLRTTFGCALGPRLYWGASTRDPLPFASGKKRKKVYL